MMSTNPGHGTNRIFKKTRNRKTDTQTNDFMSEEHGLVPNFDFVEIFGTKSGYSKQMLVGTKRTPAGMARTMSCSAP